MRLAHDIAPAARIVAPALKAGPGDPPQHAGSGIGPVTLARALMAASTWLMLVVDPLPPSITVPQQQLALMAYCLFSLLLLIVEWRGGRYSRSLDWVDLGCCWLLTAMTGGFESVLFWVLLLPIAARSIRDGSAAGIRLALAGIAGYCAISLLVISQPLASLESYRLIRPLLLLVLGYVIARSGGGQRRARRQLALLASLTLVGNPRLGVERTLANAATRIRDCFASRECLLLLAEADGRCLMVRASAEGAALDHLPLPAFGPVFEALALRQLQVGTGWRRGRLAAPLDPALQAVGDLLDARAWMSVPMGLPDAADGAAAGRLFLLGERLPEVDADDLAFLADAAAQLMQLVDKIRIVEELAAVVADRERRRIAIDLHDRAIQPYLGIQLGLAAALRRPGLPADTRADLAGLLEHSGHGVAELRSILAGQHPGQRPPRRLADALAELADYQLRLFGLQVELDLPAALAELSPRLAEELLGLIGEGLSNIVRHTEARKACIRLGIRADELRLELANDGAAPDAAVFQPKSILARAGHLGAQVEIAAHDAGWTRLHLRIPL